MILENYVLNLVIMMYKCGILSFEKFVGQTTNNVQGIRKIALKTLNVRLDGA